MLAALVFARRRRLQYQRRLGILRCEEKTHKSIRAKTVSGKSCVYCVTLRDLYHSKRWRDGFWMKACT